MGSTPRGRPPASSGVSFAVLGEPRARAMGDSAHTPEKQVQPCSVGLKTYAAYVATGRTPKTYETEFLGGDIPKLLKRLFPRRSDSEDEEIRWRPEDECDVTYLDYWAIPLGMALAHLSKTMPRLLEFICFSKENALKTENNEETEDVEQIKLLVKGLTQAYVASWEQPYEGSNAEEFQLRAMTKHMIHEVRCNLPNFKDYARAAEAERAAEQIFEYDTLQWELRNCKDDASKQEVLAKYPKASTMSPCELAIYADKCLDAHSISFYGDESNNNEIGHKMKERPTHPLSTLLCVTQVHLGTYDCARYAYRWLDVDNTRKKKHVVIHNKLPHDIRLRIFETAFPRFHERTPSQMNCMELLEKRRREFEKKKKKKKRNRNGTRWD